MKKNNKMANDVINNVTLLGIFLFFISFADKEVEKIGLCPFLKNNPAFCSISQTN